MQTYKIYAAFVKRLLHSFYKKLFQKRPDMLKTINSGKVNPMNVQQTQQSTDKRRKKLNVAQNVGC